MQVPSTVLDKVALFFDFDGTLVNIAPTPDAVSVSDALRDLLKALQQATAGALAIVTGRSLMALDDLLCLAEINASGSHGAIYRYRQQQTAIADGYRIPGDLAERCRQFADKHQLLYENKQFSLTFHYRNNPSKEAIVEAWLEAAIMPYPELALQRGKCVREIKSATIDKSSAVAFFMQKPEFVGKTPWFFGDDVTDERGFECVNQMGGHSVKVGAGITAAHHRLSNPDELLHMLHKWLSMRS